MLIDFIMCFLFKFRPISLKSSTVFATVFINLPTSLCGLTVKHSLNLILGCFRFILHCIIFVFHDLYLVDLVNVNLVFC